MRFYIKADTVDINDEDLDTKVEIASDPNTRPERLRALWELGLSASQSHAFMTCGRLFSALADNPSTPQDILKMLASPNYRYYWPQLALNPSVPAEQREMLIANPAIARHIAENMNSTSEQLSYMLETIYANGLQSSVFCDAMLNDLIRHDNLPEEWRDRLSDAYNFMVDIAVGFTISTDVLLSEEDVVAKVEHTLKQNPEVGKYVLECDIEYLGDDYDHGGDIDRYELYIYCNLYLDPNIERTIVNIAEEVLRGFGCDDFDSYSNPYVE